MENENFDASLLQLMQKNEPKVLDDFEGILFERGSCGNKPC